MANAAAGVTRSSHSDGPAGSTAAVARMYGSTTSTTTAATATALRRRMVPMASASTADSGHHQGRADDQPQLGRPR